MVPPSVLVELSQTLESPSSIPKVALVVQQPTEAWSVLWSVYRSEEAAEYCHMGVERTIPKVEKGGCDDIESD